MRGLKWLMIMANATLAIANPAWTALAEPAEKTNLRRVIGGDLIHVRRGVGESEKQAITLAEDAAMGALWSECGGVPRSAHFWRVEVDGPQLDRRTAEVEASVAIEDCEAVRAGRLEVSDYWKKRLFPEPKPEPRPKPQPETVLAQLERLEDRLSGQLERLGEKIGQSLSGLPARGHEPAWIVVERPAPVTPAFHIPNSESRIRAVDCWNREAAHPGGGRVASECLALER